MRSTSRRQHAVWTISVLALCAGLAAAQAPGQDRRQDRRDDRQDRREDRRGVTTNQDPTYQGSTQVTQPATTGGDSRQPQTHKVKSVLGTAVTIQGGLSIGTVDDIIFDDDGYIDYLVVLNQGKYVVVPWQAA